MSTSHILRQLPKYDMQEKTFAKKNFPLTQIHILVNDCIKH